MKYSAKKKIKGSLKSKTIWLSLALGLLVPVLAAFPVLESMLAEHYQAALFMLSSIVGILRYLTTEALEDK